MFHFELDRTLTANAAFELTRLGMKPTIDMYSQIFSGLATPGAQEAAKKATEISKKLEEAQDLALAEFDEFIRRNHVRKQ